MDFRKLAVRLFSAVELMKPAKSGVQSNEFFLIDNFETLQGNFVVQPKYDGIRCQIHKSDDRVVIFSDEKREIQDRFPGVVEAASKLKGAFIIDGEIIKIEEGRPERHDLVSAYVHSKTPPDDSAFHVEAFDLIFHDGQLDGRPLSERWSMLKALLSGRDGKIKLIQNLRSPGGKELVEAIKRMTTAEGAMVKDETAHYDRKFADRWWKWKRQFEVDARVKEAIETAVSGVWVYVCEIGSGDTAQEIGRTFGSKVEAKVGDIIRVFVDHVRKDEAGKWSWFAPKIFEVRKDKMAPDPISALEEMLKAIEAGVSAPRAGEPENRGGREDREIGRIGQDRTYKDRNTNHTDSHSSSSAEVPGSQVTGSPSGLPPEGEPISLMQVMGVLKGLGIKGLFVVGGFVRKGSSTHDIDILVKEPLTLDQREILRMAFMPHVVDISIDPAGPTGDYVAVVPVVKQEAGVAGSRTTDTSCIVRDGTSVSQKWVLQRHWWGEKEHWDFRMGSPAGDRMWGWTIFTNPQDKSKKHRTIEKNYHDPRWLTFEGDMQPGEPGNPTSNLIAHMEIVEKGIYEFGGRKKDFVEVFLKDGDKMNGRFVMRLIEGRAPSTPQRESSPSDEGGVKGDLIWIAWHPKEQESAFPKEGKAQ